MRRRKTDVLERELTIAAEAARRLSRALAIAAADLAIERGLATMGVVKGDDPDAAQKEDGGPRGPLPIPGRATE